jgi:hypothetical protein
MLSLAPSPRHKPTLAEVEAVRRELARVLARLVELAKRVDDDEEGNHLRPELRRTLATGGGSRLRSRWGSTLANQLGNRGKLIVLSVGQV